MKKNVLLNIVDISVFFGKLSALSDVSININKDDGVIGLIGPNGAGKTTLIHSIMGLINYTGGKIETYNTEIAYCPDTPEFPDTLTATEVLYYSAWVAGKKKTDYKFIDNLLSMVGLFEYKDNIAASFSRGMKQRLGIASALILEPQLLFLDEPTSALDPIGREEILDIIKSISKTITVVISTHNLSDIQKIANKLVVINKGKILYKGRLVDFLNSDELAHIELYKPEYYKLFIDAFDKYGIKVIETADKNVITFKHEDFPKVLELIDKNTSHLIKSCIDKEINMYQAFYSTIQKNKKNG